ncbi:MAG TPA: response regulator [Vicinamibacterales bacterium]|jgi:chemosensory pili system protein ChpA (sensor histidine kinase/response regulator)|nr:response regulator [Vicinamibacterales bacterium]
MAASRSVLVIEDDQDTRDLYVTVLSISGFTVQTARTGMEGFTRACESRPGVILTDLGLPTIDGWELVRRLKADARTADIPVIVITGRTTSELDEMASSLGTRVLLKPCPPDMLVSEVERALSAD